MTRDEVQQLKGLLVATAAYYRIKVEDAIIAMYAEDLSDLPLEEVKRGYELWRKNPKNFYFPLPGHIRQLLQPTVTAEDQARDAAGRIVTAISRFGYSNPKDAQEYIGALGWQVVQRQGGWAAICQRTMQHEIPTYQAQWAKYASSIIHLVESGQAHEPPALPHTDTHSISTQTRNALNVARPKGLGDDDGPGAA